MSSWFGEFYLYGSERGLLCRLGFYDGFMRAGGRWCRGSGGGCGRAPFVGRACGFDGSVSE